MIDIELDIPTGHGVINTFITHPEENGPHPLVLFLMDAHGKREELHDMARRLGTAGYYVMLPNLYYRRHREFDMANSTREQMFEEMDALSNAMVCDDVAALMEHAATDTAASTARAGCVGYCMSGAFVFAAMAAHADRIAAGASFHGVRLYTDATDSPHLDAARIRGEIYFACAESDEYAPPETIEALDQALAASGINYRIEWYPGADHGFVFPERQGKYHKASAERHWERLLALLDRRL